MTSSIQPLSNPRHTDAYVVYNQNNGRAPADGVRTRADNTRARGDPYSNSNGTRGDVYAARHSDIYGVPQRTMSDSRPKEK